jgi:hypothetical protein
VNNIYLYTLKKTDADEQLFALYELLDKNCNKIDSILQLYNELNKQNVRGWIMLKAKSLINRV